MIIIMHEYFAFGSHNSQHWEFFQPGVSFSNHEQFVKKIFHTNAISVLTGSCGFGCRH